MIRLAVISGKGGTGKTMVTAALADLLPGTLVLADCDVDAANLALLLNPQLNLHRTIHGDENRSHRSSCLHGMREVRDALPVRCSSC